LQLGQRRCASSGGERRSDGNGCGKAGEGENATAAAQALWSRREKELATRNYLLATVKQLAGTAGTLGNGQKDAGGELPTAQLNLN
jgi:hypothetical protein